MGSKSAEKAKKLDMLSHWLTLAANLGVLVGIVFLVYELRQNTTAIQSAAASSMTTSGSDIELFVASNHEFAVLLRKGQIEEQLSPIEQLRLEVFYQAVLRRWQETQFLYLSDALNEELWQGELGFFRKVIVMDKGLYNYWSSNKPFFSPTFNKLLESITIQKK